MTGTLTDILVVMAVAVVVSLFFGRLRLPTLVGLFAAGVLIGPHALRLVRTPESVQQLADIGVIFLLFALGLEFSFRRMARLLRAVLIAGPLQVMLTGAIGARVALGFGRSSKEALVLGMLIALSSTAVVLKTLTEQAEVDSPLGQNSLGILIFQDILVVPMMLVLPLLGGEHVETRWSPPALAGIAVGLVVVVIVGTKWAAPWLLHEAARSRSGDIFLMAVVTICFGVAALSASLGLSLALGAFLAGLIISESEYSHQAMGYVLPFRNLLVSFFFVSVGMLLDVHFLARYWWIVILCTIGLMVIKTLTGTAAVLAVRYPLCTALRTGMTISQVGEFSFVLAAVAMDHSLLPEDLHQGFLAVAVLTMAVTPIVMGQTRRVYRLADWLPLPRSLVLGSTPPAAETVNLSDHLIIIGYGVNGRNLARTARQFGIPFVVIELNPQTVRKEGRELPILYGDATNEAVLSQAGVRRARAAAVVIGDPASTRGIVAQLRRLNPSLHIIARTRFLTEVQPLYALGADDVVPEEFETSIAIFHRTAHYFGLPEEEVLLLEQAIRDDHYSLLTKPIDDTDQT